MAEVLLLVMYIAAVLYTVFAGADFGAGVVEWFVPKRERIDVAIAPVWEANHIWLILIVVLAFVGFPRLYGLISTALHLPLLMVLLGIVVRGTSFTFRHYDPARSSSMYTLAFRLSSLLTPLYLGVSMAALANGRLNVDPSAGFYASFIAPWNTAFCWATGVFTCALFTFEGAVLLAAEHRVARSTSDGATATALPYRSVVRTTHLLTIATGALVLAAAAVDATPWLPAMLSSPWGLASLAVATLCIAFVPRAFERKRPWLLRLVLGVQAACILGGYTAGQYPALARSRSGSLTLHEAAAPEATLRTLLWAVAIGLLFILPGIATLIAVYKRKPSRENVDRA